MALITLFSPYGKSSLVSLNVPRAKFPSCPLAISTSQKRGTGIVYIPPPPVLNTVQWHWVGWMLVLEVAHPSKRWRFSRWILNDIQQLRNTLEELHSINADWQFKVSASEYTQIGTLSGWLAEPLVHPKVPCPFLSLPSQRTVFCSQTHEHCSRKCSLTPVGFLALLIDDHLATKQGPLVDVVRTSWKPSLLSRLSSVPKTLPRL